MTVRFPSSQPVQPFGTRLMAALAEHGPLCVGLDPHARLLADWDLPDTPAGLREFSTRVVEAAQGRCASLKPQSAFFERHGSAGMQVLEEVLADCRDAGLLSILDVKRGDIGSTMTGYAEAYLGESSPVRADSITLSPYLGYASLRPALDLARARGRGVWVLVRTSNPEGAQVQEAGRPTVAQQVLSAVAADNADQRPCGHVGVVVGATVDVAGAGLDLASSAAPVLTPGVGAQGADEHDVARTFSGALDRLVVPVSRGVLGAGPDQTALRSAIDSWSARLGAAFGAR